ncbi:hypothetical protein [Streptomyces mexicanus]|uniref:Resolvase/invertase-type recombinase catalytic domain-containing protein n=1 Tax=Streptomyces mexicanus TaxID=178566 RepID=A0A7X1I6P5_9ACTN|nr:hypothetical protein [Streptomyces mexicanus]MBC2869790.1 hypothetical protein [Streptomyces mexicanus]
MRAAPPLAYIYDRCATANLAMLEMRLSLVDEYVTERGWCSGGRFIDYGDDALTNDRRPQFDALVREMEAAPARADRLCLLYDWGRLSHDSEHRQVFARRVLVAGGRLETIEGEVVMTGDLNGRLTSGPVVA